MSIVAHDGAKMVEDKDANEELVPMAIELLADQNRMEALSANILKLGKPNATKDIVDIAMNIIDKGKN